MNLQETLNELGTSTENIVETLRAKGIKGKAQSHCECPVAVYLNSCGFVGASVGSSAACNMAARLMNEADEEFADMPEALQRWILAFDYGNYPEFNSET